jgi:hypothetical protein
VRFVSLFMFKLINTILWFAVQRHLLLKSRKISWLTTWTHPGTTSACFLEWREIWIRFSRNPNQRSSYMICRTKFTEDWRLPGLKENK